jgi:hypothetical protein
VLGGEINYNGPHVNVAATSTNAGATWSADALPGYAGTLNDVTTSPTLGWLAVGSNDCAGPLVLSWT